MPGLIAATVSRLCGCELTATDLGLDRSPPDVTASALVQVDPSSATLNPAGDHTKRREALSIIGAASLAPLFATSHGAAADAAAAYARQTMASELSPDALADLDLAVEQLGAVYSSRSPRQLWPVAAEHRHRAFELLHHRRHTLREGRELARHAGMLSVILAWLAHDLGDRAAVRAFAADANAHGRQADAREVSAYAEDVLATHALYDGRPLDALAGATRGLALAPRGSAAAVRMAAQIARAHAFLGNAEGYAAAAAAVCNLQDGLPIASAGLFAVDSARIIAYNASSYVRLGDAARARAAADEAIGHYRTTAAPTRLSIALLDLAFAHTALGEPLVAIDAGRDALAGGRLVKAVTGKARQLDQALRRRYPTLPDAAAFHDQIRALRDSA
ncbi:hypothetical protein [Cryptosporangium sp. NPDC048952]|uniref:hypothetical protein n=1 Tax=Cryptosporangium sp. NPDC048952 TaxID=3363961 RepID=UPI00371821D8